MAVAHGGAEFRFGKIFGVAAGIERAKAQINGVGSALHSGAQRLRSPGGGEQFWTHQR